MSKVSSSKDVSVFESEWFESRDDVNEQESLKSVLLNLLKKSSVYAVSQLVTSSGIGRRVLWFLVLLIGLCGCSYEIYHFLSLYFQYPVVITLEVKNNWKLDFPAVTVCNLNRISNQHYQCLLRDKPLNKCKTGKRWRPIITERRKFASCSKEFRTFSEERSSILTFLNKYLQMDERIRSRYGYISNELITSCTFNGESCSISNFTEFLSIQFGNCFTFNGIHAENTKPVQTPYIGPNSGLELSISIHKMSYSPITSSVGARVIIHESDAEPNPEDNGINISPGYETSVAIQETSIYRLPDPYRDKCKQYKGKMPSEKNQASCIISCMQNINLHVCGCVDPFMPSEASALLCDLQNRTTVCCLDDVMKMFTDDNVSCPCPLPCKSTNYEMTISTAEWPSRRFFNQFLKEDYKKKQDIIKNPKMLKTAATDYVMQGNISTYFSDNSSTAIDSTADCCTDCACEDKGIFEQHRQDVVKLKVFYKSLEKISYKQEPMFQDSELFSQLGGQLGLWLGISLVALFECIENISHLIHYLFRKVEKTKQSNASYIQNNMFDKTTNV